MKLYGLIGYPLGHSFSGRFFTEKFENEGLSSLYAYRNFPIENISMIKDIIDKNPELCGFNVTLPYKEQIIPYLHGIDAEAEAIGAVNCVRIADGKLYGYNTDLYGFRTSLHGLLEDAKSKPQRALVLGSGGASKAIKFALQSDGIEYKTVSRTQSNGDYTYQNLSAAELAQYKLIVNTTPLGTYPNNDTYPLIPYEGIGCDHYLFDVVYNPPVSRFLEFGAQHGAKVRNGQEMLVGQALRSWEIWNGKF